MNNGVTATGERQWITARYFEDAGEDAPVWSPYQGLRLGTILSAADANLGAQQLTEGCCCLFKRDDTEFKFSFDSFSLSRSIHLHSGFLSGALQQLIM